MDNSTSALSDLSPGASSGPPGPRSDVPSAIPSADVSRSSITVLPPAVQQASSSSRPSTPPRAQQQQQQQQQGTQQRGSHQHQYSYHNNNENTNNNANNTTSSSSVCVAIDSPPPPLVLGNRNNSNSGSLQQPQQPPYHSQQFSSCGGGGNNSMSPISANEVCPFCSFDATRVLSDMHKLQSDVARLSMRQELADEQGKRDRTTIDQCLSQLQEYSVSLGIVSKWTSSVGAALPRLVRSVISAGPSQQSSFVVQPPQQHRQQQRGNTGSQNNSTNTVLAPQQLNSVKKGSSNNRTSAAPAAASSSMKQQKATAVDTSFKNDSSAPDEVGNYHEDEDEEDSYVVYDDDPSQMMSVSEVRTMFSSFRDELLRQRERNASLEQRLNDAVCRFDGSNAAKLKQEVEGRLRTMLHSLHETMNGTSSPAAQLAEQVNALRTEVELLKSKTEAGASARSMLEARVSDSQQRMRDMLDNNHTNQGQLEQLQAAHSEEMRELRSTLKELGAAVNSRLDAERSAREFEAGDIRSQLKVVMRSPSPMARLTDPTTPSAF